MTDRTEGSAGRQEPALPERMKTRPIFQGMPVPYFVYVGQDGVPDFRVMDPERLVEIRAGELCGLCGKKLGQRKVFVGGPVSCTKTRVFVDPPSHAECARYAFTVCPFLSKPGAKHADPEQVAARHKGLVGTVGHHQAAISVENRPEQMGLYFTFGYTFNEQHGLYIADPPIRIEWMEPQEPRREA